MTPTQNTTNCPVPVGELLEQLRAEGFAVAPAQYGRVFTVVETLFTEGITSQTNDQDWKTLRELLGPIVCRTFAEQERFGAVFDRVMRVMPRQIVKPVKDPPPDPPPIIIKQIWLQVLIIVGLAVALFILYIKQDPPPSLNCAVDFSLSVQGNTVSFVNRSPGVANGQVYEWNFGDGTPLISTSQSTVRHQFTSKIDSTIKNQVTLKAVGCPDPVLPEPAVTPNNYNPKPLPFLRLPETSRYVLANWVPLLLMGLSGLLGGGWWLARRRRQQQQAAQRPVGGPFFLSFPPQDDAIQPSSSLLNWAQQLQQREESERHVLAVWPTIRQTILNGGMPSVQYEAIKRRPRYLILIDDRSAYDQQAKLYAYVMGVLITRSVEMDVFFFHSDPRYLWNENYPKGLPIAHLYRLYRAHYLVLVTEGARLLDYDTGEVADWAVEALSGWTSRALLTPVYPTNWHYLEAALSRLFILLPATPDGQVLLRDYLGQPDNTPSFDEMLRQFKVLPGTPNRGIFAPNTAQMTVADVRTFLNTIIQGIDQSHTIQEWLFIWACATAVFPTPDWAMTLAIGRALEAEFKVDGLVTSTNILKLTALPWLRQDSISEPLRSNLLAQLTPDVNRVARQTVVGMLNDLKLSAGSVAYEEQQIRLWEQEFHLNNSGLGELTTYQKNPDLIKDPIIQQQLVRLEQMETKYQPLALLVLMLLPLFLYFTPPQTQVSGVFAPFFRSDSSAIDSAVYYNNLAIASFGSNSEEVDSRYELGVKNLLKSIYHRMTFQAVYNLNVARYNQGVLLYTSGSKLETQSFIRKVLSPIGEVDQLMQPFALFDPGWVPDSSVTRQYLVLLANDDNKIIFQFISKSIEASINKSSTQSVLVVDPVDQQIFNESVEKAKQLYQLPGALEYNELTIDNSISIEDKLLAFQPTNDQRESLTNLEAARIVLYFGGPQGAKRIPLETNNLVNTPSSNVVHATPGKVRMRTNKLASKVVRGQKSETPKVPIESRVFKTISIEPKMLPYEISRDSINIKPTILPYELSLDKAATQIQTPAETHPVTQLPEERVSSTSNQKNDYPLKGQSQRQQQIQQQLKTDLTDLERVAQFTGNCLTDSTIYIINQDGLKLPINTDKIIRLGSTKEFTEFFWQCGSELKRFSGKQYFTHIQTTRYADGSFECILYRQLSGILKKKSKS